MAQPYLRSPTGATALPKKQSVNVTSRIKDYYSKKGSSGATVGLRGTGKKKTKKNLITKQFESLDGLDHPGEELIAARKLYTKYIDGEPYTIASVCREAAITDMPYSAHGRNSPTSLRSPAANYHNTKH